MKNKLFIMTLYFLLSGSANLLASDINLVPYPNHIEILDGCYRLNTDQTTYYVVGKAVNEQKHLLRFLEQELKCRPQKGSKQNASIRLILDKNYAGDSESYSLDVDTTGITIKASANAGLFYGIQTFRQLVKPDSNGTVNILFVSVKDAPRFKWRAMLLDEARTFHGMKVVKQLIDELAFLKINRLQLHLTDDQAWRIEIKKYPNLTKINTRLTLSDDLDQSDDTNAQKGYYTQDEMKEIVNYAKERHITVIPEIEMPGHASAAIAAYPWVGTKKTAIEIPVKEKPVKVNTIYLELFDVTSSRTIRFLQDVLNEIAGLFKSEVIHIGGDEVNFTQWKESDQVQAFMQEKKIGSPAELQLQFTNSMSHYLAKKNIRMMGWNDIMGQNLHNYADNNERDFKVNEVLAPHTIVHFWKGDPKLISETAEKGYDVVNSFHEYTYIDYPLSTISLEKAYMFEPIPSELSPQLHTKIIGLGCQMWGGSVCTIETVKKLHQQIFPRIAAYAEVGWTIPVKKDYNRFLHNLHVLAPDWKSRGINIDIAN